MASLSRQLLHTTMPLFLVLSATNTQLQWLSKIITSALTTKGRLLLLYSSYLMSGRKLRAEAYNLVPLTSVVVLGILRFLLHLLCLSHMHRSLSGLETFRVDPAKGPFMLEIFRLTCDLQTRLDG